MKHAFADKYSDLDSPVHRLDPRVKAAVCLAFILCVVLAPADGHVARFAGYLILASLAAVLSRVPVRHVLGRSLTVVPFVIVIAAFLPFLKQGHEIAGLGAGVLRLSVTDEGLKALAAVAARSWLAALALVILSSTTPFPKLLKGLERVRVPAVFVMLLAFMYRYLFVLVDEAERMETARRSRYFGGARSRQVHVLAGMIALLFVRTYERAERIYESMRARGYDGETRTLDDLEFGRADAVAAAAFAVALGAIGLAA